jgi:hypothetical protein
VNTSNISKSKAIPADDLAAAFEKDDEDIDALESLAGEIEPTVLALAHRSEPNYTREKAWDVSMTLARSVREHLGGDTAAVRHALRAAIASRRLDGAHRNPLGFFIRGLRGERGTGLDRYLLEPDAELAAGAVRGPSKIAPSCPSESSFSGTKTGLPPGLEAELLRRLRDNDACSPAWMRERNILQWSLDIARTIVAEERAREQSATPLANELEARDPTLFRRRMRAMIDVLDLKSPIPGLEMNLDRPMVSAQCRMKLNDMLASGASFVEIDAKAEGESIVTETVRTIIVPPLSEEAILNDPILRAEEERKQRAAAQRATTRGVRLPSTEPEELPSLD